MLCQHCSVVARTLGVLSTIFQLPVQSTALQGLCYPSQPELTQDVNSTGSAALSHLAPDIRIQLCRPCVVTSSLSSFQLFSIPSFPLIDFLRIWGYVNKGIDAVAEKKQDSSQSSLHFPRTPLSTLAHSHPCAQRYFQGPGTFKIPALLPCQYQPLEFLATSPRKNLN